MKLKMLYDLSCTDNVEKLRDKLIMSTFESAKCVNENEEDCTLYFDDNNHLNVEVYQTNGHIRIDEYAKNGHYVGKTYKGRWNTSNTPDTETNTKEMTISDLETLMVKHGLVIRAIPKNRKCVYEACYADKFPTGKVQFVEEYGRNMLVVYKPLSMYGKFLIKGVDDQDAIVCFSTNNDSRFDSIEDTLRAMKIVDD